MGVVTIHSGAEASARLLAADRFLDDLPSAGEALLVGASRDAADDFARARARRQGATFGLYRFSLRQLAARIASAQMAQRAVAPASRLGAEAVAARAAFEELEDGTLEYLAPIARLRSFGRTLAATLADLRLGGVATDRLAACGAVGADVERLARRYARQLERAQLIDTPDLYRLAAEVVSRGDAVGVPLDVPVLLLDVPVRDDATATLVGALAARATRLAATVPAGDERTRAALDGIAGATHVPTEAPRSSDALAQVRSRLFEPIERDDATTAPSDASGDQVTLFSAPGETRECVEVARAVQQRAREGIPLDRMAVLLRAPQLYAGLLETALRRAGVEAWFVRGTRAPDPAGRAFLAVLACAGEQLSARRFAEYLSLGQVPRPDPDGAPPTDRGRWVPPAEADQVLPSPALPRQGLLFEEDPPDAGDEAGAAADDTDERPVIDGHLRTPWRWDRLLVESSVIGGHDRWARRLSGLAEELRLRIEELRGEDPQSPRARRLESDLVNLGHLRQFALPVIDLLASFPASATWGEWLDRLETLAPMVLRRPDRVLAVLGELRPMAGVGPVPLAEVRGVLAERLTQLQEDPPAHRYGRVFVGGPEHVRGRIFDVVFVPGLAERVFPQKQRQDPLLLDDLRRALNASTPDGSVAPGLGLPVLDDQAAEERLLLRLAVGAATERLYLSYPRLQLGESRPRVPSFYALDLERARTGRVPDFAVTEREAFDKVDARLAWPAPPDPATAIDDTEHDLAVLGPLLHRRVSEQLRGRARYLLELNPGLRRSLVSRWWRWKPPWTRYDGLADLPEPARQALDAHRLSARPYSVSALQRFARCPYQFLLATVFRLQKREEIESLERLDPLTRGRMFHEVQAELVRLLERRDALPVTRERLPDAWALLDETLDRLAARYREDLAPAIDRVWTNEIESMRTDLRGWVHQVADEDGEWVPIRAELGFGFPPAAGRDPRSVPEPVEIDGRWKLHGIVDLIEARARPTAGGELRVTDHKTGRNRTAERMVVGHGEVLQPVLYGLAVELALGRPVGESRLFFSTVAGGFETRAVTLGDTERRHGSEVLEIVDRAVETGLILPAPRPGACQWCDFRAVCGPWEETRVLRKDESKLVDLQVLRRLP